MAKGNFLLHGSRGKIGNIVTAKLKGQTIIREYNDAPANPKSPAQMEQRIKFATVGKFFSRAQQNLVKFAFENKTQNQSDYNAFVSENLKAGNFVYLTPDALNDPMMPIVAPWILTKGSITRDYDYRDGVLDAEVISATDGLDIIALPFNIGDADGAALTNWNDFLAANPSMQIGDIVTLVVIVTDAQWDGSTVYPGSYQPIYCIRQFEIGADLQGANVMDYLAACGFESHTANDFNFGGGNTPDLALSLDVTTACGKEFQFGSAETGACTACGLIISRNTPNGVKVSNSSLILSEAAANANSYLNSDEVKEAALTAWGASEDAILQGSLSTPKRGWLPRIESAKFDGIEQTLGSSYGIGDTPETAVVAGENLRFGVVRLVQSGDDISITDVDKEEQQISFKVTAAEGTAENYSADLYVNNTLIVKLVYNQ